MKVMKFGGTSVKDADRIREVASIISKQDLSDGLIVVCSAMKGVTDDLIRVARHAEAGDLSYGDTLEAIRQRQMAVLDNLFARNTTVQDFQTAFSELETMHLEMKEIAHGIFLIRECSLRSLDLMMSFGERCNNMLIAAYMRSLGHASFFVDARELVLTDDNYGNAMVDFPMTYDRVATHFRTVWGGNPKDKIAFVTGFIGATADGITTTLGRNGSDYTGAIFGAAMDATDIEIWTDVDGVLSADPRVVSKAFVISELSVEEAMEMCYFGAEVLHPYTIIPAVEKKIPIWIKNTMNPQTRGTRISVEAPMSPRSITGLASIRKVALINIAGGGMMGAKGIAGRIFASLARADANVIMISQASSEHSICVVLRAEECERAVKTLETDLAVLLQKNIISAVEVVPEVEVVSVIGANMRGKPGVAGKIFGALGQAGINVLVIAQGSSEINVSFVIEQKDHVHALNVLHDAFFPEV